MAHDGIVVVHWWSFFATLSTQIATGSVQQLCAWFGAAFLAIIPIITRRKLSTVRTESWTRARSISDGLKAEIYAFCAHAAPYDKPSTYSIEILRKQTQEIEHAGRDLAHYLAQANPQQSPPPACGGSAIKRLSCR